MGSAPEELTILSFFTVLSYVVTIKLGIEPRYVFVGVLGSLIALGRHEPALPFWRAWGVVISSVCLSVFATPVFHAAHPEDLLIALLLSVFSVKVLNWGQGFGKNVLKRAIEALTGWKVEEHDDR